MSNIRKYCESNNIDIEPLLSTALRLGISVDNVTKDELCYEIKKYTNLKNRIYEIVEDPFATVIYNLSRDDLISLYEFISDDLAASDDDFIMYLNNRYRAISYILDKFGGDDLRLLLIKWVSSNNGIEVDNRELSRAIGELDNRELSRAIGELDDVLSLRVPMDELLTDVVNEIDDMSISQDRLEDDGEPNDKDTLRNNIMSLGLQLEIIREYIDELNETKSYTDDRAEIKDIEHKIKQQNMMLKEMKMKLNEYQSLL